MLNFPLPHHLTAAGEVVRVAVVQGRVFEKCLPKSNHHETKHQKRRLVDNLEQAAEGYERERLWNEYSEADKELVISALSVTDISTTVTTTSIPVPEHVAARIVQPVTCMSRTWSWTETSRLLGTPLWTYYRKIDWCYDNLRIVEYARANPYPEIYAALWFFRGHVRDNSSGGVGYNFFQNFSQGSFELCIIEALLGCKQNVLPWLDNTVRRNGSSY